MDIEKLKEQLTLQGQFGDKAGDDETCKVSRCTGSCLAGCSDSCSSGCSSTGCASSCFAPGSNIREGRHA